MNAKLRKADHPLTVSRYFIGWNFVFCFLQLRLLSCLSRFSALQRSQMYSFLTLVSFFLTCYLIQATIIPSSFRFSNTFLCIQFTIFPTIFFAQSSHTNINRTVMLSFVNFLDTSEYKRTFVALELPVKDFFMCVEKASVHSTKHIMSKIEERMSRRKYEIKNLSFRSAKTWRSTSSEQCKFIKSSEPLWSSTLCTQEGPDSKALLSHVPRSELYSISAQRYKVLAAGPRQQ